MTIQKPSDIFHVVSYLFSLGKVRTIGHRQTFKWMTSPVAGAVRIMPAVGRGVPGTSTGVIETDLV